MRIQYTRGQGKKRQATLDTGTVIGLVIGGIGLAIAIGSLVYAWHVNRQNKEIVRGFTTGGDSWVDLLPVLATNGFGIRVHNQCEYPVFDIYIRVFDYARDVIFDPSAPFPCTDDPVVSVGKLGPSRGTAGNVYEFDMSDRDRVRANLFISSGGPDSIYEIVAVRDGERIRFARRLTVAGEIKSLVVPDDFPGLDQDDPEAVFGQNERRGKMYQKVGDQLIELN